MQNLTKTFFGEGTADLSEFIISVKGHTKRAFLLVIEDAAPSQSSLNVVQMNSRFSQVVGYVAHPAIYLSRRSQMAGWLNRQPAHFRSQP